MRDKLRMGGRIVLDLNNREYYSRKSGERVMERGGRRFIERSRVEGERQVVELDYMDGKRDLFTWEIFTSSGISSLANELGLETRVMCAWFDENKLVTPEMPRMQLVFERVR
jgi:hypothetical protein